MVNKFLKNIAAGVESIYGFACDTLEAIIEPIADDEVDMPEESIPDPTVHISQGVLDNFRKNVGRYAPETPQPSAAGLQFSGKQIPVQRKSPDMQPPR